MNWLHRFTRNLFLDACRSALTAVTAALWLAIFPAQSAEAASLVRLIAGNSAGLTDSAGREWSADFGYADGNTATFPSQPIDGTNDPDVFRSERWAVSAYQFSNLDAGSYQVNLYFVENYFTDIGEREFDVQVGGNPAIDVDIVRDAGGPQRVLVRTQTVTVSNSGTLDISFTSNIENPKINAIEIARIEPRTWRSYDTVIHSGGLPQATVGSVGPGGSVDSAVVADLEFYESTDDGGVAKDALLGSYYATHTESFNHVETLWADGSAEFPYPYVGKSTVGRGSDSGESNAGATTGVFDLQVHPPNNDHLVVAAFKTPQAGHYHVSKLGVRRVDSEGSTVHLRLFDSHGNQVTNLNLKASNDGAWARSSATFDVGSLAIGDYIYFAVDADEEFDFDATEISWQVEADQVPLYEVYEVELDGTPASGNPFDVDFSATFTGPSGSLPPATGFYAGDNKWKVRFAPEQAGSWSYVTTSAADTALDAKTGTFRARSLDTDESATNHGFIKPHSVFSNPVVSNSPRNYYFDFSDGTPFYGIGDTAYFMTTSLSDSQIDEYLDTREEQGFNFIRLFASGQPDRIHSSLSDSEAYAWNYDNGHYSDFDRFNPAYFARLESILAKLAARGMRAEIEVFNYYSRPFLEFTDDQCHSNSSGGLSDEERDRWGQYVVARLAAYQAVFLWTVTNEYEIAPNHCYGNTPDNQWAIDMVDLFHANDVQQHPATVHNFSFDYGGDHGIGSRFGSTSMDVLTHQHWNGPSVEDSYDIQDVIAVDRNYDKPVINTESGYELLAGIDPGEGAGTTTANARQAMWKVLIGGGATYAAGFAGTWQGADPISATADWTTDDSGLADNVSQYADFINTRLDHRYRDMNPDPFMVDGVNVCLSNPGEEYVIYAPAGGNVAVHLDNVSGDFTAHWFNVIDGSYPLADDNDSSSSTVVHGGATRTFSPPSPSTQDWVLHLEHN